MKRILLAAVLILFTLAVLACQATPERHAVVKKDAQNLLEMAQRNGPQSDKSLSEQYDIPERYQFEMEASNGNLSVKVDADVIVPQGNRMPIYRVQAVPFSQEVSDVLFRELCGDTEMWQSMPITKDRTQDEIIVVKRRIAELEANPELAREPDDLMWAISDLKQLEKQLSTAPETVDRERADGKLREMKIPDTDSVYIGFSSQERPYTGYITYTANEANKWGYISNGKQFSVYNNEEYATFGIRYINSDSLPMVNVENAPILLITDDADVTESILSQVRYKPSEAKAMVQALLDKTGLDMVVDSIYLKSDAQVWKGAERPAAYYQYEVYCVRMADGYPCSYVNEASTPENDVTGMSWWYESLVFWVNGNGIVTMLWDSPIEVLETVLEDAQLLSFSDIQQTFERMMRVKYAPQAKYSTLDFQINRVTLSLHRIVEQNSNEFGLLVPAWNFYGKSTESHMLGDEQQVTERVGESFMTINAIDGSVIDNRKGY